VNPKLALLLALPISACGGAPAQPAPVLLVAASAAAEEKPSGPELLGSCISPGGIAVNRDSIFCSANHDHATMLRFPKSGGAPSVVAESGKRNMTDLAADDQRVYWIEGPDVFAVSAAGGTPQKLSTGAQDPADLAADGAAVYWTNSHSKPCSAGPCGDVVRAAKDGGAPVDLAPNDDNSRQIALDASHVYTVSAGVVLKVPKAGGTPVPLFEDHEVMHVLLDIAADTSHVYVMAFTSVLQMRKDGSEQRWVVPKGTLGFDGIALDETHIYLLGADLEEPRRHHLIKVPKAGGEAVEIASEREPIVGVALDERYAYWAVRKEGVVRRARK
jgi:hypothetical protein